MDDKMDRIQREHELEVERQSKRSEKLIAELSAQLKPYVQLEAGKRPKTKKVK